MKSILFPLGDYTKEEARRMARENNLPVAQKPGSQEICFLPDPDYREFLKNRCSTKVKPGPIVDKNGNLLGWHKGIAFYTIGQREGLGLAKGYPLHIVKMQKKDNKIIVGRKEDVYSRICFVKRPHYLCGPIKNKVVLKVKIRYNHKETEARCLPYKSGLKIIFDQPQLAITPGQSAVLYDHDQIIAGGIIEIH